MIIIMKTRRMVFSFLTLFILLCLMFVSLFYQSSISTKGRSQNHEELVLSDISQKLRELDRDISNSNDKWIAKNMTAAKMMASALKNLVTEDGYSGPAVFDDGFVLRNVDGKIVYPESLTGYIKELETGISILSQKGSKNGGRN